MTPSTGTSPATLDLFVTEKDVCRVLRRISNGDPLPENVLVGIDPYQCKPENLPGTSNVFLLAKIHVLRCLIFLEYRKNWI